MMTLDPTTLLSQSGSALATEVDGEVVLIGIETGQYYGLDAVGKRDLGGNSTSLPGRRALRPAPGRFRTAMRDHPAGNLAFLDQLAARNLITTG